MDFSTGTVFHIFNRTNAGRLAFYCDRNYRYFHQKIARHIAPHASVLAYCLMPNHFHILLVPKPTEEPSSRLNHAIGVALRSYTRALQNQEGFTGSLFQQHTKARCADDYAQRCFHYIHQNPLHSGYVEALGEWTYSSFHEYTHSLDDAVCDVTLGRELLDLPRSPSAFSLFMRQARPVSEEVFGRSNYAFVRRPATSWRYPFATPDLA